MATVIFMGTPHFAVPSLQKLIESQTVVGVITQPDRPAGRGRRPRPSPVKIAAEEAGLPIYQPESLRGEEAAAPLRLWQPDVIVVAAYGQILRPHVLTLPPHGCLNVHASLLPRWRGASPIHHAILAGDTETGVTMMKMDAGMDTGPIYVKRAIPIQADETAATLHDRLAELGAEMLGECLNEVLNGRLVATPQNDAGATYARLIKKEDGRLDWRQTSAALARRIRALDAFTTWQEQPLKILAARAAHNGLPSGIAGRVVARGDSAVVLTQDGGLELQQIQLAGKRAMTVSDFVRGRPDFIGSKLGD